MEYSWSGVGANDGVHMNIHNLEHDKPIVDNITVSDIASELVRVDKSLCH